MRVPNVRDFLDQALPFGWSDGLGSKTSAQEWHVCEACDMVTDRTAVVQAEPTDEGLALCEVCAEAFGRARVEAVA